MNLTPELIAQGWKPISEIVNEKFKDGDKVELILVDDKGRASRATIETPADIKKYTIAADYRDPDLYRRLIPITPDTIIITREDAVTLISYDGCYDASKVIAVSNKIKKQLEG